MPVNTPQSFEDSVGEPVPLPFKARLALGGCWRPRGLVSETFREIYPIILKVAKTHLESPEDVILGCYMLGYNSRTAVPYVSFASRDRKYRRELRKLVQNEILQTYPGWKSVDWNQDPGSRNMTACGSEDHDTANSAPTLRIKSSTSDFGGSKILLLRKNGTNEIWQHIATGGGIIANGKGSCFLMTAAHSLPGYEGPSFPLPQCPDEFEFNMDDLSDDEEPDELGVESTSLGSRTPPETRRSSTDELSSRNSQSEEIISSEPSFFEENVEAIQPTTSAKELQLAKLPLATSTSDQQTRALPTQEHHPPLYTIYSKTPSITSSGSSHPGLDYALIELNRIELGNGARSLETGPPVAVNLPGPREVVVTTSSHGKTKGRLLETPLFVIRSDTADSQELWTVILDKDTREGDSGSWVFDATSGEMIGHIVAASTETGSTLIIPAFQVLEDLHQRFDGSWRPITNVDGILVHTSTAVAQRSSAQQSFAEPSTLAISSPIDPQTERAGGTATSVTAQRTLGAISPRFLQPHSSDAAAGVSGDQESLMPHSTAIARRFNTINDPELAAVADAEQPCNYHTKSPPTPSSSHPSSSAERSNKVGHRSEYVLGSKSFTDAAPVPERVHDYDYEHQLRDDLQKANTDLNKANAENDKLKATIDSLTRKLAESTASVEQANRKATEANISYRELKAQLEGARSEADVLKEDKRCLNNECDELKEEAKKLKEDNERIESERHDLEQRFIGLHAKHENLTMRFNAVNGQTPPPTITSLMPSPLPAPLLEAGRKAPSRAPSKASSKSSSKRESREERHRDREEPQEREERRERGRKDRGRQRDKPPKDKERLSKRFDERPSAAPRQTSFIEPWGPGERPAASVVSSQATYSIVPRAASAVGHFSSDSGVYDDELYEDGSYHAYPIG